MQKADAIKRHIELLSQEHGFACFGIVDMGSVDGGKLEADLSSFVADGFHGEMSWLASDVHRRSHVLALWPQMRSIIMLGFCYTPRCSPLLQLKKTEKAAISVYAQSRDYHIVIKKKLKAISAVLSNTYNCENRVYVDTAPLMEKPLANAAGLGWQGKHTNLVSRRFGSWLFLSAILTDLELEPDIAEKNHCGSCRLCLDICPTKAFVAPYKLDARRCISYLTIEYKGIIPLSLRSAMGNRVFGCDDCLAVCPWNKFAQKSLAISDSPIFQSSGLGDLDLADLIRLDESSFRDFFRKTPMRRAGAIGFMRNVIIAIGNSGSSRLGGYLWRFLSHDNRILRATAIWAFSHCVSTALLSSAYSRFQPQESDPDCSAEWDLAKSSYLPNDSIAE